MRKRERLILAIDTAGSPSQILLFDQEKNLLAQKSWSEPFSQSRKTLNIIDRLLKQEKRELNDLGLIVVNQGPTTGDNKEASFTGLKVGATIANTLSLTLKIPLNGISLKGRKLAEIVKETDFSGQKRVFINPIYPRPPNISLPKS